MVVSTHIIYMCMYYVWVASECGEQQALGWCTLMAHTRPLKQLFEHKWWIHTKFFVHTHTYVNAIVHEKPVQLRLLACKKCEKCGEVFKFQFPQNGVGRYFFICDILLFFVCFVNINKLRNSTKTNLFFMLAWIS